MSIHRLDSSNPDPYTSLYSAKTADAAPIGSLTPITGSGGQSPKSGAFSALVDQATPAQPRLMQMVMSSLVASMGTSKPSNPLVSSETANAPASLPQTDSNASTTPPAQPMQAMSSFMRNLMMALQSQNPNTPSAATDSTPPIPSYHSGLQKLDSSSQIGKALHNLMTPVTTGSSALQQSYAGLVSSLGGNPQNASLNQFLSNFEQQLQSMGPTGNLVNVTA